MNYELCKQLKDNGFPEPEIRNENHIYLTKGLMSNGKIEDIPFGAYELDTREREYPFAYVPTLSELIEACGLPFDLSCRNNAEKWYAFNIANNPLGKGGTTGDSPEEAVANLWLALNKK